MNGLVMTRDLAVHDAAPPNLAERPVEMLAKGLSLRTRRGVVYEDIDLSLERGTLGALVGPSGSGKTALLLGLSGRMRFTEGSATVCGLDVRHDARRVRGLVGLGIIPGVNDLDDTTTIAAQVRAELTLYRLPHDDRAVHRLLDGLNIGSDPHAQIGSLSKGQQTLLGIGLGLLHNPRVLMVDGADLNLTEAEQGRVWGSLRRICDGGVTIMATCLDRPLVAGPDVVIDMAMGGAR
jgi:ABC-2 type transport system ATP-binding protein